MGVIISLSISNYFSQWVIRIALIGKMYLSRIQVCMIPIYDNAILIQSPKGFLH